MKTTNEFVLIFTESGKTDSQPVSRLPSGKICFLTDYVPKGLIRPGEEWKCVIESEFDKFAHVRPVEFLRTQEETREEIISKLNKLKCKFA